MGEDRTGPNLDRALTVAEAASALGISQDAVRKRIRRGTIRSDRDASGRVYVFVPASETVHKTDQDTDQPQSTSDALISEMRGRIASLERQLESERQANSEHRRLLAAALERIPPQLEAPSEARESPESPDPTGELGELREELDTERTRRERAESTLREGMDEERRRREEAERERDDLRRELFARREPRESPQTVKEEPERAEPQSATAGAQGGTQRRSWLRRMFGR